MEVEGTLGSTTFPCKDQFHSIRIEGNYKFQKNPYYVTKELKNTTFILHFRRDS